MTLEPSIRPPRSRRPLPEPDAIITVVAWRDPVVDSHPESHPTSSVDTLVWWTPILGPTATLMAHRFAGYVARSEQVRFSFGDVARTLGMGSSMRRVRASLDRLERFHIITVHDETVLVRVSLPPLTRRQIGQLPAYLVDLYEARRAAVPRPASSR